MVTQARVPMSFAQNNSTTSLGIIGQITTLLTRPVAFFRKMPRNRQWLWIAILILVIFGMTASIQVQSSSATTSSGQDTQGFSLSLLQDSTETAATTSTTTSTESSDTNTALMSALLTACTVLLMWLGQALLLSIITMLRGYLPNMTRNIQIAVWSSLPLALMLGLRQIYFFAGGTGGSLGLSLLLEYWDAYSTLPETAQRILAVFMSNLTLFWLWSLFLLYFGARYTLHGKRWSIVLVLAIWIAGSTIIPALVSEPVTTTAPLTTTTVVQESNSTSTTETSTSASQMQASGMFQDNGGGMMPPSGGPPGG